MKTSLNDTREAEKYLLGHLPPDESLLFQARLLTNPILKLNVAIQQKVSDVLRYYHHKKIKSEIEAMHRQLFHDSKSEFRNEIIKIFTP